MISVLATPGTVSRDYTRDLVRTYAAHCDVTLVGSDCLADLAEAFMKGEKVPDAVIAAEIAPCFVDDGERRTDCIVLACTHYPLLLEVFERVAPWPVESIDPAEAIARRVDHVLREEGDTAGSNHTSERTGVRQHVALFTSTGPTSPALKPRLPNMGSARSSTKPCRSTRTDRRRSDASVQCFQDRARRGFVALHRVFQLFDGREFFFAANEAVEIDLDRFAIKVAGKIKEEDFEQRRPIVEGRPAAKTRDTAKNLVTDPHRDGIDAIAEPIAWIEAQIGGRKSEAGAALVAMNHLADDEIRTAEQIRGALDIAQFERCPRRGRGDGLDRTGLVRRDAFDDLDREPMMFSRLRQKSGRAEPLFPK